MFQKRICVVVGGAKGTGRNLVENYAIRSYDIALMDTDKEAGNLLKEKIERNYGRRVFFFHGDADSEEDLELFAGAVIGQYGKVDCIYYRTDIAKKVKEIENLLEGHVKNKGIVENFLQVQC